MTGLAFPKPRNVARQERRRIRAQSKRDSSRLINRAAGLARELVLKRCAGKCESCGLKKPLDAAHGFGKKAYPSVRFDGRNLFGLCRECHEHYGSTWGEWLAWMGRKLGLATFEALRAAAHGPRPELAVIVAGLQLGFFSDQRRAA